MRIQASNRVVDDHGTILIDSFWRHDCLIYMAFRDAGFTHEQTVSQMAKKYVGGGPRPRFFMADKILLTDEFRSPSSA
jgi:hypothetical protein